MSEMLQKVDDQNRVVPRTFVVGDIHGAHKALLQVLERSGFNKEIDTLICLGDVADGWPEVPQCFEELLTIKNLIYVLGNHDEWFRDWFKQNSADGTPDYHWVSQGGEATWTAYGRDSRNVPAATRKLLHNAHDFYVRTTKEGLQQCFVHGGLAIDGTHPIGTSGDTLRWDRTYWMTALRIHQLLTEKGEDTTEYGMGGHFDEVFIGHTQTKGLVDDGLPVRALNVWNLDQGAGWSGKLTIMDADTKEFWQSDLVTDLYPNVRGRR